MKINIKLKSPARSKSVVIHGEVDADGLSDEERAERDAMLLDMEMEINKSPNLRCHLSVPFDQVQEDMRQATPEDGDTDTPVTDSVFFDSTGTQREYICPNRINRIVQMERELNNLKRRLRVQ